MGRDKAMIVIGGKTMLARAVETLRSIHPLGFAMDGAAVTVIGERTLLEGADRSIMDNYPESGPLGGMEAALADLESTRAADCALFLPVDMPFLPVGLVEALLREWVAAADTGVKVCYVVVDGTPQPLVSLIHRGLLPYLSEALRTGNLRVTPVLQSASNTIALLGAGAVLCSRPVLWQTIFTVNQVCALDGAWSPAAAELRSRHLWFANLNTEDDLREAETFFADRGSLGQGFTGN